MSNYTEVIEMRNSDGSAFSSDYMIGKISNDVQREYTKDGEKRRGYLVDVQLSKDKTVAYLSYNPV